MWRQVSLMVPFLACTRTPDPMGITVSVHLQSPPRRPQRPDPSLLAGATGQGGGPDSA